MANPFKGLSSFFNFGQSISAKRPLSSRLRTAFEPLSRHTKPNLFSKIWDRLHLISLFLNLIDLGDSHLECFLLRFQTFCRTFFFISLGPKAFELLSKLFLQNSFRAFSVRKGNILALEFDQIGEGEITSECDKHKFWRSARFFHTLGSKVNFCVKRKLAMCTHRTLHRTCGWSASVHLSLCGHSQGGVLK